MGLQTQTASERNMARVPVGLVVLLCWVCGNHLVAGSVGEDLSLPIINAHFEYAAKDASKESKDTAEFLSFKDRVRHVQRNIDKDEEVIAEFAELANSRLNDFHTS